jgi:polyhydroxyalkanoate synthase subunit PhaC
VVAAKHPALQHEPRHRAPRPLPLFLDMVRAASIDDPELARRVLAGLRAYADAPQINRPQRATLASHGRARLIGHGDGGPPVVLVPSLINPPTVLDLDPDRSLLRFLGDNGHRAMMLDWGVPTAADAAQDIAGHIEELLIPLLRQIGEPVHLVGYCLGGTIALACAAIAPVRSLTLLATPWHFARYPWQATVDLTRLWQNAAPIVDSLGLMPIELLQTAFWTLDPDRTLAKYAALADSDTAMVARFALLEDWANDGAPLTAAAGSDLFGTFIADDDPGQGRWRVGGTSVDPGTLTAPAVQFTASHDRIAPSATASDSIRSIGCSAGHVGMVVGSGAKGMCWQPMADWLALH